MLELIKTNTVCRTHCSHNIYISDYLKMEMFLYKKNFIENCEKNYKQTCSKQKIANVSSVNQCHKIDTSSRVGETEHMRSRQNVPGRSMASNREIAWRTERLRLYVRYANSKRSPSSNAIMMFANIEGLARSTKGISRS